MTIGEHLKDRRQEAGKTLLSVARELFSTGRFGHYKNLESFMRSISNLERDNGEKDRTKRNLKMFDGRIDLWAKAYGTDKGLLTMLLGQDIEPEETDVNDGIKARTCRGHNLFLVFSVLKEYSKISEREHERVIKFVERLDVVPTEEIIRAYVSQVVKK